MGPKRRRIIWLGAGLLFALAVGSGYIPDLMLAREEAAARQEGLIVAPPPSVPKAQDARLAYEAVRKRFPGMVSLLPSVARMDASSTTKRMFAGFVEASRRPVFRPPAAEKPLTPTPGVIAMASPTAYADQTLVPDLRTVAETLARLAPSEEALRGAARIAAHLQNEQPEPVPSTNWSDLAMRVLDRADRLRLLPEARARVVADLSPPDPITLLRRRASLLVPRAEARSSGAKRQRIRFIRFWREFLKTAPREPEAFARWVAAEEERIVAADEGIGAGYMVPTTPTPPKKPWAAWASGLAKVSERLKREPRP